MITLYHGSNMRIERIDLSFSRYYRDFGKGFYLTPDYGRAVRMATRTHEIRNFGTPTVNDFRFDRKSCGAEIRIKEFLFNTAEWALFILENRYRNRINKFSHVFDIVIGPVADSPVDITLRDYMLEFGNEYGKTENLELLAKKLIYPGKTYTQYCFCTEKSLKYLIKE